MPQTRQFTTAQIESIAKSSLTAEEIMARYNISESFAKKIIIGKTIYTKAKREPVVQEKRFTDDEIRAIRADTRLQRIIAEEYGVAKSMISCIKSFDYYASVPGPGSRKAKRRGPYRKLDADKIRFMLEQQAIKKRPLKYWAHEYGVSITTIFSAINGFSYADAMETAND